MRPPEDKIKEAILHPDLDVRDSAIRYFYSSTTQDDSLMLLAIQAIERYGRTKALSFTHYLNLLPQTEMTIGWVIAELQGECEGFPEDKYLYYLNLSRLLCHADIRLVASRAPEIIHAPHFDPTERLGFHERLEMFGWDAAKCWQALLAYCEAGKHKTNLEEFDLGPPLRMIEALARQPHEYQGQIVAILTEKVQDFRHDVRKWLQPLMANLAGAIRLPTAIPTLVANLGHPFNFLADQSMFALVKIGTEEVVSLVCDQYPRASKNFRLYASDLLCKIHLEVTDRRVLELLPGESDFLIRMTLCEALIDHFNSEAIEPTRHLLKQYELTADLRRLRVSLFAACKVMEARFPEFDEWEAEAKRDAKAEQERMREFNKMVHAAGSDPGLLVQLLKAQIAKSQARIKKLEAEIAVKEKILERKSLPRPIPGLPHGRETRANSSSSGKDGRIGRNDPCPCGSGKKFKTCCLRK